MDIRRIILLLFSILTGGILLSGTRAAADESSVIRGERRGAATILIAGAGHGGLAVGGFLAERGYRVEIFEKNSREEMGWDWHDNLRYESFAKSGIPAPPAELYGRVSDFSFVSPTGKYIIRTRMKLNEREIVMDRKKLVQYLLRFAEERGAVIHFNTEITGPCIESGIITGLISGDKIYKGDLVIDSAGINSPVRTGLPDAYGIKKKFDKGEMIHVYRAYFNMEDEKQLPEHDYLVYMMPRGIRGIAWLRVIEGACDVLVASLDEIDHDRVEAVLESIRSRYKGVGSKIIRGGYFTRIPLRHPLELMVGHNYAAIGDAAAMTVPVIGSGLENSLHAAKLLAETIVSIGSVSPHNNISYHIEDLWNYQYSFYREAGARLCFLDRVKGFLLTKAPAKIESYMSHGIIKAEDFQKPLLGQEITLSAGEMVSRFFGAWYRPDLLLPLKSVLDDAEDARNTALEIPPVWNLQKYSKWKKDMEECFR